MRRRALSIAVMSGAIATTPAAGQQIPTGDPAAAVAHFSMRGRAWSLYDAGRFAEAEPLFLELVRATPHDGSSWLALARTRHRHGDARGAIAAYRTSLQYGSRSGTWATYQVARLYAGIGQPDSALVWLERALARRWDDRPGIAADTAFADIRGNTGFMRLAGTAAADPPRDEAWARDLDYLVAEAKRMHAGPDRPAHSARFDSAAASLSDRIPELSNDRMVLELSALVTLLGDGHSGIYGPGPDSPLRFESGSLPLLFYEFADGLFVIDAVEGYRQWIGAEVLRFGDIAASDAVAQLPRYMHHDNLMTVKWLGVQYQLPSLSFLHAIGAARDPRSVTLTLRTPDGREQSITLDGGSHAAGFPRKLQPPDAAPATPLYLSRLDENYWVQTMPDWNSVYFQFNQVRNAPGGPTIRAFADSLRATLEHTDARNLIIDVRFNNGGNNGLLRPLLRTLVWWDVQYPERSIYVITGRNTFSAAQNFINRLERYANVVFVGEPSSSRPNFTGEETNLLLPHSRIRGSISTLHWQDSDPDDDRAFIAPHLPVGLHSTDYFAGRDPALEAILTLVQRQ